MSRKSASNSTSGSAARAAKRQALGVLHRLYERLDELPTALARIAKYIVENPEKVVRQSVSELGEFSGSGEASIIRLCQLMDFSGFRDFKLALAAELGNISMTPDAVSIDGNDGVDRLHTSFVHALDIVRRQIDPSAYEEAAGLLAGAHRIDIYGAGVSGIIAELLAYRLLRLGVPAQAFRDGTLAHEVAGGLGADCVAIAVSESGLSDDAVKFLKSARVTGARTIAVTNRLKSPMASEADITLHTASIDPGLTAAGSIRAVPGMSFAIEALALELIRKRDI